MIQVSTTTSSVVLHPHILHNITNKRFHQVIIIFISHSTDSINCKYLCNTCFKFKNSTIFSFHKNQNRWHAAVKKLCIQIMWLVMNGLHVYIQCIFKVCLILVFNYFIIFFSLNWFNITWLTYLLAEWKQYNVNIG